MPDAFANGIRLHYDDTGQGEPALLFLHGWAASSSLFKHLAAATHYRVLTLDWRGHGQSETPSGEFGAAYLVEDALAVIEASGAQQVIPVALSHSGWVAIELRRHLRERIPGLVLLSWIVMDAPLPFLVALHALQDHSRWEQARKQLFTNWMAGITDNPEFTHFIHNEMGGHDFEMWSRAAREISTAYAQWGSPLKALAALNPSMPTLHLYAQPADPGYLAAQEAFASIHPWYSVRKLNAKSHFPMFEIPEEMAGEIEGFVSGVLQPT